MQSKELTEFIFQGYDPRSYLRAASKLLIAGAVGVLVGWILQPFFSVVFGLPYWVSYWPAILGGFLANLRTQVKLKNLKLEKKMELTDPNERQACKET